MIAEGQDSHDAASSTPHIALVPGAFMFLTVVVFNRIGERAQRAWARLDRNGAPLAS